jgi:hypothetical protein
MITREHARTLRRKIEQASVSLPDADALEAVELFPHWDADGKAYEVGDRVQDDSVLYKCLQAHTSQASWKPADAPSLWVRVDDPSQEWPEWVQPMGSTDAYALGAKVSHNEKHWVSMIDANIWEPGAVGSEKLWEEHE